MTMVDPGVIDMVAEDPESGKLLLVMVEERPWNGEPMLEEFVAKLSTYVGYALSEQFAADHPHRQPGDVLIKLDCAYEPNDLMRDCFREVPARIEKYGISFACEVFDDTDDDEPESAPARPWWRFW